MITSTSYYKNTLVDIILKSSGLTNDEKYNIGLPCYISNYGTYYSGVGNGYYLAAKYEPQIGQNSDCSATTTWDWLNPQGFVITSNCKGTIPYVYTNNAINLEKYTTAKLYIEYYRNCPGGDYTMTSGFGFSKTKGAANTNFDLSYSFNFNNASSEYQTGGENHKYLTYTFDISNLNTNYYYKHYLIHNGPEATCSGYNIIKYISLY